MWASFHKFTSALPSVRTTAVLAATLWLQMAAVAASVVQSSSENVVKGSDDSSSNMGNGTIAIAAIGGSIGGLCSVISCCWYFARRNMQPAARDDAYHPMNQMA